MNRNEAEEYTAQRIGSNARSRYNIAYVTDRSMLIGPQGWQPKVLSEDEMKSILSRAEHPCTTRYVYDPSHDDDLFAALEK